MPIKTKLGAATLAAGLVAAVPAPALAHGGGSGDHGRYADVPSRIATKLKKAEKALDRAQERADDGNADGAVSQLAAVRRNLAAAEKAAVKRMTADSETGPDAGAAVAAVESDVVNGTADAFDGVTSDAVVDALDKTLDAAISGRDSVVAAVKALDADTQGDYYDAVDQIDSDTGDEADSITEAISDDELTAAAKGDLEDAVTALKATGTSVSALAASADAADTTDAADYGDGEGRGHGGRGGCHHGGSADPVQDSGTATQPGDYGSNA